MTEPIILSDGWDGKARAIPDAEWDRERKAYVLRREYLTPRSAMVALKLMPELALAYPELATTRDELVQDVRPFDNATPYNKTIDAPYVEAALLADGHEFYQFQSLDLGYLNDVLETHGGGYLGWERGMGKTLGAYALIESLGVERALVVCPNTAKQAVWQAEAEKFYPYEAIVLPNVKRKREATIDRVRGMVKDGAPFVLIVHYEALNLVAGPNGKGWNKLGTWPLVVCDEVHRIKNIRAQMTRALKRIKADRKLAMSGSIIENHAEELFSPLQWLFPERYSAKWRDWNDRFLDYVENGYGRIFVGIKPQRLEALREELGVFMVYRRKQDELDMPPRTDQDLFVDLSPRQRRVYDELITTCMSEIEEGEFVFARDGLPMLSKLRQVATGLDLVAENVVDSSKLDLALDLIRDSDETFVVFGWYKASLNAMAERLEAEGIDSFIIHGDVSHKQRGERIAAFANGDRRVLLGTLSTMGESVNLQVATQAIFLDRAWNPALNAQAEDRIYRMGQEHPVTITHIIARDTADELRVQPTIANKDALRRMILGG